MPTPKARPRTRRSRARAISSASLLCLASCAAPTEEIEDIRVRDGQEALELLLEGNVRFTTDRPRHSHESQARRARLGGGQSPFSIVLGCADSRVPPELIFDAGLGDMFVIRVAGNFAGVDESGSIEYALVHLGTPLVLVMGHEGCGAITAALGAYESEPEELRHLIDSISPGLAGIDPGLSLEERVHLGVEANVRRMVGMLEAIRERENRPEAKRALIVGGVYELGTGRVRILD